MLLTITISARALLIALITVLGALAAVFATDALAGSGDQQIQGDINCDEIVDAVDILDHLYDAAGFDPMQNEPCTDIGDAFPLGTSIVGPSGPPGPTGVPGPPGINMWANITAQGAAEHGTATAAVRNSMGKYTVTFATDISACTVVATPGLTGTGAWQMSLPTAHLYPSFLDIEPEEVWVSFQRPTLEYVDTEFHLIVVC